MELVAWLANEPWSDAPTCACPVMSAFVRSWNDALRTDADRDRLLKPMIPFLLDSKQSAAVELARSYLAFDWLARVQAPAWMDLTDTLRSHAVTLRALAPLTDRASVQAAGASLAAARDAAGAAARAAAWDSARAAAWDAAWDSAGAAARAAAWDAARAAAWDAARAAAWDSAGAALQPTVTLLEASAVDLMHRMLAIRD